jgi:hypothetical protein
MTVSMAEPDRYIRRDRAGALDRKEPDEADIMVWVAPHQYVNLLAARKLGFVSATDTTTTAGRDADRRRGRNLSTHANRGAIDDI